MSQKPLFKTLEIKDKVVLVTGASAGIGTAVAYGFAEQGCKLILLARRYERLQEIKDKIQQNNKVDIHLVTMDVQNTDLIEELPSKLPSGFQHVDIIVNNAGLGLGAGSIDTLNLKEAFITIDTNIKACLAFMRVFIPGMKERECGHVINISSAAANHFGAGGSVYMSTKHALKCISECSRSDLDDTPVRITEIRPGYVSTEFFDVRFNDKQKSQEFKEKIWYALDPMDIADNCVYAATRPAHVQIDTITVLPKRVRREQK